ncbi:unnamed protein product [Rodentolepis nana]|uniref:Uncharacterized protein n=1 Tax=Rodentolepis nana TaxID=102285 RepID=A0A0R3TGN9_RODNA|nr:unnamed protein product [Rodentolepis nana]
MSENTATRLTTWGEENRPPGSTRADVMTTTPPSPTTPTPSTPTPSPKNLLAVGDRLVYALVSLSALFRLIASSPPRPNHATNTALLNRGERKRGKLDSKMSRWTKLTEQITLPPPFLTCSSSSYFPFL